MADKPFTHRLLVLFKDKTQTISRDVTCVSNAWFSGSDFMKKHNVSEIRIEKINPMKPEHHSPLLETTIICVNRAQQDMGLEPEEIDEKIVIDLREVIAIRSNQDETDGRSIVTIYGPAENWTVHGEYDEIIARWKAFKNF